ncbi:hypothetical protein KFU94_45460 [Chloroflexi bacterium TSY]|nr:hypothetical protein [Chloroflexi bacterium TSY]
MEISFFQDDEPLRFERIVLYPYPDLTRIWTRLWVTAKQDEQPNIALYVLNPDGTENCSVDLIAQGDQKHDLALHLRDPKPGAIYRVVAELTMGLDATPNVLDHQEFDMMLEFRDPERKEPGFGMGVDWDDFRENA